MSTDLGIAIGVQLLAAIANIADELLDGAVLPGGSGVAPCNIAAGDPVTLGVRSIRSDGRSHYDPSFRWPWPGGWTPVVTADPTLNECGTGLHVSKGWIGMASVTLTTNTIQIVAYRDVDIAHNGDRKIRASQVAVLNIIDIVSMAKNGLLANANLREAFFIGTNLSRANLCGVNLFFSNLTCANLYEVDLRYANLHKANLERAYLRLATLKGADLRKTNLKRTDLRRANLLEARLDDSNLYCADLSYANLTDTSLAGANLRGADLSGADLSGSDLYRADLRSTYFTRANLTGADLRRADLRGSDLEGANLTGAKWDKTTKWPRSFKSSRRSCKRKGLVRC